ncbi:hypothetical protein PM082_019981 [Marasmius tenuissimus]|nr:hypothetical protein PM082_019981 [Marasmius tenuissimus]
MGISDFDTSDEEFPIRSTPRSVARGRGVRFAATPSYREVTLAATSSRRPGEIRAAGYRHTPLRVGSSPSSSESEVEKKGKLKGKKIRDDNAPKNPQNPPSNNESSDDVRIKIVEMNSEGEELTLLERKVEGERQEVPAGSSAEAPKSKRGSQLPALESSISAPDIPHRSSAQPPVPPSSSTSMTPRAVPLDRDLPPHLPQESSSSRLENQDESKIEGDRGDESDERMKRWKEKGKWKAGESSTPPGGSGSRDTSWRRSSRANAGGGTTPNAFLQAQNFRQAIADANESVSRTGPAPSTLSSPRVPTNPARRSEDFDLQDSTRSTGRRRSGPSFPTGAGAIPGEPDRLKDNVASGPLSSRSDVGAPARFVSPGWISSWIFAAVFKG